VTATEFGAILAAAGTGTRYGSRKQFLTLAGRPILHYSLDAFLAVEDIAQVVLVAPAGDQKACREVVKAWALTAAKRPEGPPEGLVTVVEGGKRRQDSVIHGLAALDPAIQWVLVHDAARPLLRAADVRNIIVATRRHGAAVLGTPVTDSVKRVREGCIVDEIPRGEVWTVQTPQSAAVLALRQAYGQEGDREWTDEASALRAMGARVVLVEGPRENIKITHPGDEALAESILRARRNPRQ
jgi:2-C-methyl-D-erythritol 4-phosphate cytidylyltransferase